VERVIGPVRRECLNHIMVFNDESLRRVLRSDLDYLSYVASASIVRNGFTELTRCPTNWKSPCIGDSLQVCLKTTLAPMSAHRSGSQPRTDH